MPENKKGKAGRSANAQKREKNKTRAALAAWRHNAKGKTPARRICGGTLPHAVLDNGGKR